MREENLEGWLGAGSEQLEPLVNPLSVVAIASSIRVKRMDNRVA